MQTIYKNIYIPEQLDVCEQLFDKNVQEIKKLVKYNGYLPPLIHKEQKQCFCMMAAILLLIYFLTRLIRRHSVIDLLH